jgi:broad specificity phosphatase PhoE
LIGDFRRRVRSAFERIVASLADGESVAVSHGGVIAAILADFVGATYEEVLRRVRLDNAGITACEFSTRPPHVAWINATGHLDALEAGEPVAEWP